MHFSQNPWHLLKMVAVWYFLVFCGRIIMANWIKQSIIEIMTNMIYKPQVQHFFRTSGRKKNFYAYIRNTKFLSKKMLFFKIFLGIFFWNFEIFLKFFWIFFLNFFLKFFWNFFWNIFEISLKTFCRKVWLPARNFLRLQKLLISNYAGVMYQLLIT